MYLVIVLRLQHRPVAAVHTQAVDNIIEVGLEEQRRGNPRPLVQTAHRHLGLQVQRHHDVLLRPVTHVVQLLHQVALPLDILLRVPQAGGPLHHLAHRLRRLLHLAHHQRRQHDQVRMGVKHLVEEVAAVMGGQLGMPNHPGYLPDSHWLHTVLAVVDPKLLLKVDGILGDLFLDQKYQLLALQKRPKGQALEVGAEGSPIGIVEVDMVFPADVLALADIVVEILQLILGVDILRQNGVFQVLKEVPADDGIFKIHKIPKPLLRRVIGDVAAVVVKGEKQHGQLLEGHEVPPKQVGVF